VPETPPAPVLLIPATPLYQRRRNLAQLALAAGFLPARKREKGIFMTGKGCACGFTEAEGMDETLDDHLREVFTPDDGRGPDGMVHFEGLKDCFCLCGAGGSAEKLDSHFLEVFTSADSTGLDGVIHKAVV
jgi:hypothetical protein